jgi:nitrogen fixation protein NifB
MYSTAKDSKFGNHPCFNAAVRHSTGRIHLPVAPECNIQCNFCNRKYDCVNESRPGVTSSMLTPDQAVSYLDKVLEIVPAISVVGIAGPGDPFATPEETLATLEAVGKKYPGKLLCLASNGLNVAPYVDRIAKLNVSHMTITVNAVDPGIGAQIYGWIRSGPHVSRGAEGARVLLEKQTETIRALHEAGILVKINTVVIPGINDHHVAAIAGYCKKLGADIQNCIPMMHVEGSAFENREGPEEKQMLEIRKQSSRYLDQMCHCARCRADAIGQIGEENNEKIVELLATASRIGPTKQRPYVAVASMEGLLVNQHLGEATELWVFKPGEDDDSELVSARATPVPGGGDDRWEQLADAFGDCFAIICAGCGKAPLRVLAQHNLPVIVMEGLIEEGTKALFRGQSVPKLYMRPAGVCSLGKSCGGSGTGCD